MEIPPRGTRGTRLLSALGRLFMPLAEGQVTRYRKNAGPTATVMMGFPTVLLTTVGARTGKEHTSVLGGFEEGPDSWIIVASKSGSATHPHWVFNLAKHPDQVWLEVGTRKVKVTPHLLKGTEREEALAKVVAVAPRYGDYQKKTDREIPIVRLTA